MAPGYFCSSSAMTPSIALQGAQVVVPRSTKRGSALAVTGAPVAGSDGCTPSGAIVVALPLDLRNSGTATTPTAMITAAAMDLLVTVEPPASKTRELTESMRRRAACRHF